MRKYEPIWIDLKKKKFVRIAAHPALHRRIIKAVIKEKDMDIGFKFELSEVRQKAKLGYRKVHSEIQFFLQVVKKIGLEDL